MTAKVQQAIVEIAHVRRASVGRMPPNAVCQRPGQWRSFLRQVRELRSPTALTVRRNMKCWATIHSNLAKSLKPQASILPFAMSGVGISTMPGMRALSVFLEEQLTLDAVRCAHECQWTVTQIRQCPLCDGLVIPDGSGANRWPVRDSANSYGCLIDCKGQHSRPREQ
jgi:hypothetical protein